MSSELVPRIKLTSTSTVNSNNQSQVTSNKSTRLSSPARQQIAFIKANTPAYKQIKIDTESTSFHTPNLSKSVSFDTVAVDYASDIDDDSDDDYEFEVDNDNDDYFQRHDPELSNYLQPGRPGRDRGGGGGSLNRMRSPSPYRDLSPMRSSSFSSLCDIEGNHAKKPAFDQNGWRIDYPSESVIKHDSLTYSFKHPNYVKYIKENDCSRTLIVYITGRRHTWVALDYTIAKLLRHGDHVVVMSRVPLSCKNDIIKKSTSPSSSRHSHHRAKNNKLDPSLFRNIARDIKRYVEFLISDSTVVKFTIDLVLADSTNNVLKEAVSIYDPSTIISSTKPNLRFLRKATWGTSKITDRLVQNFELPIIVVPAFTLNEFEVTYFEKLVNQKRLISNLEKIKEKLRQFDINSAPLPSIPSTKEANSRNGSTVDLSILNNSSKEEEDKESNEDVSYDGSSDDSSIVSVDSDDSVDSSDEDGMTGLTRTITNYKDVLDRFIEETESEPITKSTFLKKLNKVTDTTYKMSLKFAAVSEGGGEEAALVRSITGLPDLEKKTSMLDVLEPVKTNQQALNKIRGSLTPFNTSSGPYSNGSHSNGSSTPRTIKFSNDISTPEKLKVKSKGNGHELRKFRSHVETNSRGDNEDRDRALSPTKSQPQHTLTKSLSETKVKTLSDEMDNGKKKKSSFLRNLFGNKKDRDNSRGRRPSR